MLGLRAIWFGHASVYLEIDRARIMVDPMLSEYTSPLQGVGPKRFHPPPLALHLLPKMDAVVISHDHYAASATARRAIEEISIFDRP